ncbi:MAG TPA: arginine--tRNA ligase, partial [bacterium]
MKNVESMIQESIRRAAIRCGLDAEVLDKVLAGAELSYPKQKQLGDLASNAAMVLGKKIKQNPRELSEKILGALELDPAVVQRAVTAGAGFINFTLSPSFYLEVLSRVLREGKRYGRSDAGGGKKTQVEFVSANPTGPLTIGHGRQAVIGDTIARLLEATGHSVVREYYFNDAGRQMRVLAESVLFRYRELLGETIEFPTDHYQGEYIRDIARLVRKEKGESLQKDAALELFQKYAETVIFKDIQKTLLRLGIRFDVYTNEKSLYESGKVDEVIRLLRE